LIRFQFAAISSFVNIVTLLFCEQFLFRRHLPAFTSGVKGKRHATSLREGELQAFYGKRRSGFLNSLLATARKQKNRGE
jgi:hypothetical protein